MVKKSDLKKKFEIFLKNRDTCASESDKIRKTGYWIIVQRGNKQIDWFLCTFVQDSSISKKLFMAFASSWLTEDWKWYFS